MTTAIAVLVADGSRPVWEVRRDDGRYVGIVAVDPDVGYVGISACRADVRHAETLELAARELVRASRGPLETAAWALIEQLEERWPGLPISRAPRHARQAYGALLRMLLVGEEPEDD